MPFTAFGCSNAKKTINLWLSCGLAIGGLSLESLEHLSHNLCYIFGCGFRLWQRCNERFSLMVAQVGNAPIGNAKTFFSLSASLLMFFKEIAKSVMAWHRIKCLMVLLQDYLDDEHFLCNDSSVRLPFPNAMASAMELGNAEIVWNPKQLCYLEKQLICGFDRLLEDLLCFFCGFGYQFTGRLTFRLHCRLCYWAY